MERGDDPAVSGPTFPLFNDEDPKEFAAGAVCFAASGGVLGGISAAAGTAAVVVSLPGILAGAAAGASVYGTCVAVKWTFKKVKSFLQ